MSRISISWDEDYPGQFDLWQANCRRSLLGASGKRELAVLRDALLALPDKRLLHRALVDEDNDVCAIGAYARQKGLNLGLYDPEDETDEVGIEAGMPRLAAWKIVEMNDETFSGCSPEDRYTKMLAWVESLLASTQPES